MKVGNKPVKVGDIVKIAGNLSINHSVLARVTDAGKYSNITLRNSRTIITGTVIFPESEKGNTIHWNIQLVEVVPEEQYRPLLETRASHISKESR